MEIEHVRIMSSLIEIDDKGEENLSNHITEKI